MNWAQTEILPFGKFTSNGDYTGGDLNREVKPKLALGGTYDLNNRAFNKTVTGKKLETQYTFGVSKYIVGHKLKIQSDLSYLTIEGIPNASLMHKLQFEIHF